MGNVDTKLPFRKAVVQLISKTQPIDASDDCFWEQFWGEHDTSIQDVFTLIPAPEIRALREEAPSNLATLCYKAVEKLVQAADTGCSTHQEQLQVLNCVRLLTRIIPYIFEDPDWRGFFWSNLPTGGAREDEAGLGGDEDPEGEAVPLAHSLIYALCDLLFCPDFTVSPNKKSGPDKHEDLQSIDSCEYIWESGVGFAHSPPSVAAHDQNKTEILKLILTCFSQAIYQPVSDPWWLSNKWISVVTCAESRHALPLFTSLLNVVCGYEPGGGLLGGLPYDHLLFTDTREPLVQAALQILITTLDHDAAAGGAVSPFGGGGNESAEESSSCGNLFINYLSRIHREEDFRFVLRGFTRLLTNPLQQTYLPHSTKRLTFHQEILVFFWKFCDYNKKFLFYVLKSSEVLDILVPILYHLNDARADQSRVGLMHIGVFILLLLSGERNFGVRLNKPYSASVPMDIPVFTGTHADLVVIVFHKIITTGHQRLQPLFDCLLTILVNVSPYMKTLSMVSSTKMVHLLEAFSTPWFLLSAPLHHHLAFFLLETFNNVIQYQFDGNSNLIYTIIRKRQVFHALANLPTDAASINKSLLRRGKNSRGGAAPEFMGGSSSPSPPPLRGSSPPRMMEGSHPARPAQPGTKTTTLPQMPRLEKMTEKECAHPSSQQLSQLTSSPPPSPPKMDLVSPVSPTSAPTFGGGGEAPFLAPTTDGATSIQPTSTDNQDITKADKENITKPEQEPRRTPPAHSPTSEASPKSSAKGGGPPLSSFLPHGGGGGGGGGKWSPTAAWVAAWKGKLPLQTIMRLLQVLVPQVEKICIDKGLTDESEILRFLQHGTLVGLLPVPHPILIRKYQANAGTAAWFRTYMWGVIYLRNVDPPIWYDTDVRLFEIQRV